MFVVGPDYKIAYWDHETAFLTGTPAEEAVGKRCYEIVLGEREGGEPFCMHGCSVMRMSEAGRPVSSYEMRVSSPGGKKRWMDVSILSVESEEGPYIVHLLRDTQQSHEILEMARGLIQLSKKQDEKAQRETSPLHQRDIPALTSRQLEVLNLLAEGKSAKEIGRELYLSEATVRNHIRSLLQALDAHSQLEALAKARSLGVLSG